MKGDESFLWYRLFRAPGFGPKSMLVIHNTMRVSGITLQQIFDLSNDEFRSTFRELGKGKLHRADFSALHRLELDTLYQEYQELTESGAMTVHPDHPLYPRSLLVQVENGAPLVLFCKGHLKLLGQRGIAIVGSRRASDEGVRKSRELGAQLARQGYNVISGYAKGVDTSAHLGALQAEGTTTIVLSQGILEFSKKRVFSDVRWDKSTLVVSQFQPKARWNAQNAMIRNKLICALSDAVVVVESGLEKNTRGGMSGTFDTGRSALEMRVPLFVLSPVAFATPPLGNSELVGRGGIEINQEDGVAAVLRHLGANASKQGDSPETAEQLSFLSRDSEDD